MRLSLTQLPQNDLLPHLLRSGAPHYLDEIIQPQVPGEGFFDLIGVELVVLLRGDNRLVVGAGQSPPGAATPGPPLLTGLAERNLP